MMTYRFTGVSTHIRNDEEVMKEISNLWKYILSGEIPIYDEKNIKGSSPISKYINYESDENGFYDFTIMEVKSDFFDNLKEKVSKRNDIVKSNLLARFNHIR